MMKADYPLSTFAGVDVSKDTLEFAMGRSGGTATISNNAALIASELIGLLTKRGARVSTCCARVSDPAHSSTADLRHTGHARTWRPSVGQVATGRTGSDGHSSGAECVSMAADGNQPADTDSQLDADDSLKRRPSLLICGSCRLPEPLRSDRPSFGSR